MSGNHDDFATGTNALGSSQKLDAIHARHSQVGDYQIEILALEQLETDLGVGGVFALQTAGFKLSHQHHANGQFIIDNQNSPLHRDLH